MAAGSGGDLADLSHLFAADRCHCGHFGFNSVSIADGPNRFEDQEVIISPVAMKKPVGRDGEVRHKDVQVAVIIIIGDGCVSAVAENASPSACA